VAAVHVCGYVHVGVIPRVGWEVKWRETVVDEVWVDIISLYQ